MPLTDHLGEFRRRLTIIIVALLITACVMYEATPSIIEILVDPIAQYLPNGGKLTVLTALGGFTIRFKVAMFVAVIVCTPLTIWEIMAFFLPALKPNERKWVEPTVAALVILFFIGMVFCYFVILPAAFGWLIQQTNDFATVTPTAEDYLNMIMLFEIGFGLAFELPLVIFYLVVLHLVPYRTMRQQWRYVYIGLMVLSAMVTPDGSPVTMLLMFAALIGLYELSLLIARQVIVVREGKQALKYTRDDYDNLDEEDDD
jgi:sec-independent protein translocase protein TatC